MNAAAHPSRPPSGASGFEPTHLVPREGMPTWSAPDPAESSQPLPARLPVRLLDRHGDWGHVLCSNGWSAWVDARRLVLLPRKPPLAGEPGARTADARPLLGRAEETLGRYRHAVEELAAGRLDAQTFQRTTQGLRIGVVVDGDAVWLYDQEGDCWYYCDGTATSALAGRAPSSSGGAGRSGERR